MLFNDNQKSAATPQREAKRRVENPAAAQNHSATDDFGAYNQPQRKSPARPRQMPRRNAPHKNERRMPTFFDNFNRSSIIVALIAVVALIALIGLVVVFISNSSKDIKYDDGVYLSTCDDAGIWHVMYNGKVIGEYDNEIEMITAEDRSFAYIIENTTEGYLVHIAKGKKVETILSAPATKILATASLSPAVVWLELGKGIHLYTEEHGEEKITKNYSTIKEDDSMSGQYNYIIKISADGTAVAFSQIESETGELELYVYRDSMPTKLGKHSVPVAISDDGQSVFAYGISNKDDNKLLYVISGENKYLISEGFEDVIALNANNNEIVYTTNTETGIATYIYAFNPRKMDDDNEPHKIGNGVCVPVCTDPEIARSATFKKTYFERIDGDDETGSPTYFVNKKYESSSISSCRGTFTPDGDYFYFIKSGALQRIELKDKNHTPETIANDIIDFAITQKSNVYWLNDSGRLSFYNASKDKTTRIADDAGSIEMHDYSNTLYYTSTESTVVYTTKEGSSKGEAKLGSVSLVSLPEFLTPAQKKSYVAVWDPENETCNIFYTANGKTFKHIATCIESPEINISEIKNNVSGSVDEVGE